MGLEELTKIKILPSSMRLHEWICLEKGYYREEGLDVEVMWEQFGALMSPLQGGTKPYRQRVQDVLFLERKERQLVTNACMWGSVCNAGAGMGKFVPDVYGIAPHGIYVRPESRIRKPEDLKDVPIAVAIMTGSHYNVPYRLEHHLPLEHIKVAAVGGFGERLAALLNKDVEAASLLGAEIYLAEELGLRKIIGGEFNTLWWVSPTDDPEILRRYFTALDRAEQALTRNLQRYLPLWKKNIPPRFADRQWHVESWGPGERFVLKPFPRDEYEKVMASIERWGMGVHMEDKNYERIIMSLSLP
jgi:hypothetical protein